MSRRPAAVLAIALTVGLSLAACAAEPVPEETSVQSPTSAPTVEVLTVGAGERPPAVFDDDCDAALTAEQLSSVVGVAMEAETAEKSSTILNVGGITCTWRGDAGAVRIQILPTAMLADVEFPPDAEQYYFADCDPNWVCAWESRTTELWIMGGFQLTGGMSREGVDEWAGQLASLVEDAYTQARPDAWARDEAGWWPVLACPRAAELIAAELGTEVSGEDVGYVDPPIPGVVVADEASNAGSCWFSTDDSSLLVIEVSATSGTAWGLDAVEGAVVETGVPGFTAKVDESHQSVGSIAYVLSDGVNLARVTATTTGSWSAEQALAAVAQAAASGW